MMKLRYFLRLALVSATVAAAGRGGAVTLDGSWKIVVPANDGTGVSAAIRVAAEELQRGLADAAGLKLAVAETGDGASPAIWLGRDAAERRGFGTADLNAFDNVIAEKGGDIFIFGNDRSCRSGARSDWNACLLPTVRGVARFLQTYGGVDWTLPGKTGRTVRRVAPPELADGLLSRETPRFDYMAGSRVASMMFSVANGLWGCGLYHTYGGHTFPEACPPDKLFDAHPEYFAVVKGQRKRGYHLCISNPAVEELVVAELLRRYDAGSDVCELGQEDGFRACECEACRALFGTGDDWGEKLWIYFRRIAERIGRERPGKLVQIISYGPTTNPPKTFTDFPSNVMIELTTSTEEQFAKWKPYGVPHGFTVYTYFWGCYPLAGFTPKLPTDELSRRAKSYVANRIRGVYFCGYGELFGLEGPGYYVFSRTLLDPEATSEALLADYCAKSFGPAAPEMLKFYRLLDERLKVYRELYQRYLKAAKDAEAEYTYTVHADVLGLLGETYPAAARAGLERHLKAARATPGLDENELRRLQLVNVELSYLSNLGEIAERAKAYSVRPDETRANALADSILWRNAFLDKLYEGGTTPRRLPKWSEVRLFRDYARSYLQANGRNAAAIGAPLDWDPAALKDMYAVGDWKKRDAANKNLKPVTTWRTTQGSGSETEVSADGRALHFVSRPSGCGGRAEHSFANEWKAGATYRVSWYSKVRALKRREIGGCAKGLVQFGADKARARQQYLPAMRTTDSDWVRQSIEVTVEDLASASLRFSLWAIEGEVWIENVSYEEIQP